MLLYSGFNVSLLNVMEENQETRFLRKGAGEKFMAGSPGGRGQQETDRKVRGNATIKLNAKPI